MIMLRSWVLTSVFFTALALTAALAAGAGLQSVVTNAPEGPPAGGGGDSLNPVMSPDGRFVLFAGSANNLVPNTNRPALSPPRVNVFLRDRLNGRTTLISANIAGTGGGNGDSTPIGVSTNGQFVLFSSLASNLVPNDANNAADIFLRDVAAGTNLLVSVNTNGVPGNLQSWDAAMTPDGRYVAFSSAAQDLVPNDTNSLVDIFVRDMQAGVTVLATPGASVGALFPSRSDCPLITPDGRFVAFLSSAVGLVSGVQTQNEVYVRDLTLGTTYAVSTNAHQYLSNSIVCYNHAISEDGRYVVFEASSTVTTRPAFLFRYDSLAGGGLQVVATNAAAVPFSSSCFRHFRTLDLSPDGRFVAFVGVTNSSTQIYLWDGNSADTTLISQNVSGLLSTNGACDYPVLDASGSYVAFLSTITDLTTNTLGEGFHLYVRDAQSQVTRLADGNTNSVALAKDFQTIPCLTPDGRFLAFDCSDADLVANDNNHASDVFVRDLTTNTVELVSVRAAGLPSQTASGLALGSQFAVSADGRYVTFTASVGSLLPNCTNVYRQVLVADLLGGSNILVSVDTNGLPNANGTSTDPAISGDGSRVAFASRASNLTPGDINQASDVFVRDLVTRSTILVSVATNGISAGNTNSSAPVLSADGRYVLFRSRASNLAPGTPTLPFENLFLRDLQVATTYAVSRSGILAAAMTPDARFVAFTGTNSGIFLWDAQSAAIVFSNTLPLVSFPAVALSPDGNRLAARSSSQLYLWDHTGTNTWVLVGTNAATGLGHGAFQFSGDGRYLVFATSTALVPSDTNGKADVYLYDFQTQTTLLISHSLDGVSAGNDVSDSPALSPDGRLIAWRSSATNIVSGDTNVISDVYVFDRFSGVTTLLSQSAFGAFPGNEISSGPIFSGDSRTVVFRSWASDFVTGDFNQSGDLFAAALQPAPLIQLTFNPTSNQPPVLSWAAQSGVSYQVLFKNTLSDSQWQDLNRPITLFSNQATVTDPQTGLVKRFYRVKVF